jgi:sorbitol-specific phosphotransferase system component IIA
MPKPIKSKPAPAPQVIEELRPGQSIELLKELHILTREGKLNQDTRRKLKQVYHCTTCFSTSRTAAKKPPAMFTASRPAPSWSPSRASWRPGWVLSACLF